MVKDSVKSVKGTEFPDFFDHTISQPEFDEWMKSLGVDYIKSYASPRGMYCHNLGLALKDMGYSHTRDFGYSVDDYPYFPMTEGEVCAPLQLPSDGFNVCRLLIRNKDAGMPEPTVEEMLDMYKKLMDLKAERDLPMLFFCHPHYFGLFARELFPAMVDYAKSLGAVATDYIAYGDFWLERDGTVFEASCSDDKLTVDFAKKPSSVRLCVDGKICDSGNLHEEIAL